MIKKSKVLFLEFKLSRIIFLFIMLLPVSPGKAQGLLFNSNDSLLRKRTSFEVFRNDVPTFNGQLTISFDLSLWDNEHLGYVFNITDNKDNSYSLSYIYSDSSSYLNFNIDSKSNKIKIPLSLSMLQKRNWMNIKVLLDLKSDKVEIFINGKWYRSDRFGFENKITPKITFGKNKHYTDVPNMAIKNLSISDGSKKYFFPLAEWENENVFSKDGEKIGFVENPVWLINESYFWKQKFSRNFKEIVGLNFDQKKQELFIFKENSLVVYNTQLDKVSDRKYQNKNPVPLLLGKSILNPKENKCYVYEVNHSAPQVSSIASLDLSTLKWDAIGKGIIPEQRHHHNMFYDKNYDDFYLFGGYGGFSYHNNFVQYNKAKDSWQNVAFKGDTISPRFFSGYSQANDQNEVYIFGGFGNPSGDQIVGGKHYYDLYRVDLTNRTIKKCWEIQPDEEHFVAANNLIISSDQRYFYALCYPHEKPKPNLRLYKFSIEDGSYEIVSEIIPVTSERIETDINLFLDPKSNELICTVQEFTNTIQSVVKIYSLSFPSVSEQEYLKAHPTENPSSAMFKYILLASMIPLAITGAIFYRKTRRKATDELRNTADEDDDQVSVLNTKKENAVYLLGEFIVYDKNRKDITYLFSPKIKQLFLLILLNSEESIGVSSKKLSATLWPDRDVSRTKNIKAVTINHLRNIIADIDGIELFFLNDTYYFKLDEAFFCDYFTLINTIKKAKSKQTDTSVLDSLDLIASGGLLPDLSEFWLDEFKHTFEEMLMPLILPEIKKMYDSADFRKTVDISRAVLNIDPFNDEAIKYKLKALRRTKGLEYARKVYVQFAIDYKKSLNIEYPIPFDKICSIKS